MRKFNFLAFHRLSYLKIGVTTGKMINRTDIDNKTFYSCKHVIHIHSIWINSEYDENNSKLFVHLEANENFCLITFSPFSSNDIVYNAEKIIIRAKQVKHYGKPIIKLLLDSVYLEKKKEQNRKRI